MSARYDGCQRHPTRTRRRTLRLACPLSRAGIEAIKIDYPPPRLPRRHPAERSDKLEHALHRPVLPLRQKRIDVPIKLQPAPASVCCPQQSQPSALRHMVRAMTATEANDTYTMGQVWSGWMCIRPPNNKSTTLGYTAISSGSSVPTPNRFRRGHRQRLAEQNIPYHNYSLRQKHQFTYR